MCFKPFTSYVTTQFCFLIISSFCEKGKPLYSQPLEEVYNLFQDLWNRIIIFRGAAASLVAPTAQIDRQIKEQTGGTSCLVITKQYRQEHTFML